MRNINHFYFMSGFDTVELIQEGYKITKVHSNADGEVSREDVTNTIINEMMALIKAGFEKIN